jgi:hypothetical protein
MTKPTTEQMHEEYLKVVKSTLAKIQKKHPGQNPAAVLDGFMQAFGTLLVGVGDLNPTEAFVLLGFAGTVPSAAILKHKGPAEVAPFVKSMAELFAYTLLDRLPVVIDQIVKQDSKRAARVTLPS